MGVGGGQEPKELESKGLEGVKNFLKPSFRLFHHKKIKFLNLVAYKSTGRYPQCIPFIIILTNTIITCHSNNTFLD